MQAVCVIATRQKKRYAINLSANSCVEVIFLDTFASDEKSGNVFIEKLFYRIKVRF